MLDHEHYQKLRKDEKRDWVLTVATGVPAVALIGLIIAVWKYIGHDPLTIIGLMIPAAFVAVILMFAALNGRRSTIKQAWKAIVEATMFWPIS